MQQDNQRIGSIAERFRNLLGIGRETFCRYAWSYNIKESPWRAIGQRSSGKPVSTFSNFYSDAERFIPELGEKRCSVDCFLSPNEFFDWRNTRQLSALHANWLEIDIKEKGARYLSEKEQHQVKREVLEQLATANIPKPNALIFSGSGGLHCYWIYAPVEAYRWRVNLWKAVSKKLSSALSGGDLWEVDFGASHDPARVLRIPGTYHGGTGRRVEVVEAGELMTFDNLVSSLEMHPGQPEHLKLVQHEKKPKPKLSTQDKPTQEEIKTSPSVKSGKHTIGMWWYQTYSNVVKILRGRGGSVKEGQRDSAAFILYVALRHIKGCPDRAISEIEKLNKELIKLPNTELNKYLSTARSTFYKYRKDTLCEYLEKNLNIDAHWLYAKEKIRLSAEELKARLVHGASKTAQSKRSKTLGKLAYWYQLLKKTATPVTQERLSENTGYSVRTIRRYWNILCSETIEVISYRSIYSATLEQVSSY